MTVGVIFGGRSCEHNISIITAVEVLNTLENYNVIPIYIDNFGVWWTGKNYDKISTFITSSVRGKKVYLKPYSPYLYSGHKKICRLDVALLCNHGLNGEDGSIQGLLQLCKIPYTCSNILSSSITLDKITMKQLFSYHNLPVLDFIAVDRNTYENNMQSLIKQLEKFSYPLIIKPSNLGSSIGINIAKNIDELFTNLRIAFSWDNKVIIEKALTHFIELNCAVLKDRQDYIVSEIEQPIGWKEFLTFDDKYNGKNGKNNTKRIFPASIDEDIKKQVQKLALKTFKDLGMSGVARIDFMLDENDNKIYVNEINAIPGSLAHYLFKYNDISFSQLIDILIRDSIYNNDQREKLKYSYNSKVMHQK